MLTSAIYMRQYVILYKSSRVAFVKIASIKRMPVQGLGLLYVWHQREDISAMTLRQIRVTYRREAQRPRRQDNNLHTGDS